MKKILLFMLVLFGTMFVKAADDDYKTLSFYCSETAPLAKQLTSEMSEQVESLTISGTLWGEDIKAIDRCRHLSCLELTEATLRDTVYLFDEYATVDGFVDAIGADVFRNTAIETLFLPKNIGYFDLRALSFFTWDKDCGRQAADWGEKSYVDEPHFEKTITVYVTGTFPSLYNPQSISGYYGCPMVFKLAKGNELYTETEGNIFSKDEKTLIKAGKLYDESLKDYTFDVQSVRSHAFTYSLWSYDKQMVTFTKKLNSIYAFAFTETAIPYIPTENTTGRFGGIRFLGWTPAQIGEGFDSTYGIDKNPLPCKAVVPHKMRYIASDIRWLPYVMDEFEYGVACGTMSPDERDTYYNEQDKYGPRVEDFYKRLNETYQMMDVKGEICYSSAFNYSWDFRTDISVSFPTDYSISFSFINPQTDQKETIECVLGRLESYSIETKIIDETGTIFCAGERSICPGTDFSFDYSEYDKRPGDSDTCLVSCRITGTNYIGPLDEHVMECMFEEVLTQKIDFSEKQSMKPTLYDLQGRLMDSTQKGILIRNGKKVLVK